MSGFSNRRNLRTEDFDYPLPDSQIARFPLLQRDNSRLLVFKNGAIEHRQFSEISRFIPLDSLVVFNNTLVIPARLHFKRQTGAWIEVLAIQEVPESTFSLASNEKLVECMVGNKKKWADLEVLDCTEPKSGIRMEARWQNRDENIVRFTWFPENLSYHGALAELGEMPIPPYLNRPADPSDKENYQTIYARNRGAIAAPTAGLHFTQSVFKDFENQGITSAELTLHVGLGTFKPMKSGAVADHEMHGEEVIISDSLLNQLKTQSGMVVAVGTTAMRSLESLYWIGIGLMKSGELPNHLATSQPYEWEDSTISIQEVVEKLAIYLKSQNKTELSFTTQLFIMPGYRFRVVGGLITNFHQPKSTLLVLVSAFIGEEWKKVYQEALQSNYRFLSYGDSSFLIPN